MDMVLLASSNLAQLIYYRKFNKTKQSTTAEKRDTTESPPKGSKIHPPISIQRRERSTGQNVSLVRLTNILWRPTDTHRSYKEFVSDRSGSMPVPPEASGIGIRATLG